MKGVLQEGHIPLNNFSLTVIGLIGPQVLTLTAVTPIREEVETVELPDFSIASLGRTKNVEFTGSIPMHHRAEQIAMELWLQEARDDISVAYKKKAILSMESIGGFPNENTITDTDVSYVFTDLFPVARTLPALDMGDDGNMAVVDWTFRASTVVPLLIT